MLYDRDIREPLFDFLEDRFGKIRIIEEKTIGRSRADVLMVTENALIGVEIKSDADTYARLSRQIADYDLYCDSSIAVVGLRHTEHIWEHVPAWWGIITAESTQTGVSFYMDRKPRANPNCTVEKKMSILWRSELQHLLSRNGLPRHSGKNKKYIAKCIAGAVEPDALARQISDELFERDYTALEDRPRTRRGKRGIR
ncbi:MAG: sce7726 family protein [Clostridia bacterium]|nr:sce7726 family protein [Clostridia bacterium]